jgi:tRNA1(Val) A37 N6-methylase TrmN6
MSGGPQQGAVTEDHLLGGRVRLRQPAEGARAAIDPVFLAAAVDAEPSHTVLDLGCGTGAAMLCLAARVPQSRMVGLDMQRELVRIAGDNVILNGMSGRLSAMIGDLMAPPPRLSPGSFDHVMANPPYLAQGAGTHPATVERATATIEGRADLGEWVRFALTMLRAKGTLTLIHRADRIDTVLAHLAGRAGEVTIFPLWPGAGQPATRVLVRARKQIASPARLCAGLVLHAPDGRFTADAEAVLRGGAALAM